MDKVIIWTRSKEDWEEDRKLFKNLAHILKIPCIKTRHLDFKIPKLNTEYCLIFSSSHGINSFLKKNENLSILKKATTIYAVGDTTRNELNKLGIIAIIAEQQNLKNICEMALKETDENIEIISIGAKKRAFNQEQFFASHQRKYREIHTYENIPDLIINKDKLETFKSNLNGIICFASPSAFHTFSKHFTPSKNYLKENLIAIAIGQTTAEAIKSSFSTIKILEQPTVAGLATFAEKLYQTSY